MELEINYRFFTNESAKIQIQELVEKHKWILPDWLYRLNIDAYQSAGDGADALTKSSHEYRVSNIAIADSFFSESKQCQDRAIIHEFIHVRSAEILDFITGSLIEPVKDRNPELFQFLNERSRVVVESFTEDFAHMVKNINDKK